MALSTKVSGVTIKQMALEDLSIKMEMFMRESGKMIRLQGKEPTFTQMEQDMKVPGSQMPKKEREQKLGQMVLNISVHIKTAKSMVMGVLIGVIVHHTKGIS